MKTGEIKYVHVVFFGLDETFGKTNNTFRVVFRDVNAKYYMSTYVFTEEEMDRDLLHSMNWHKEYIIQLDMDNHKLLNAFEKVEVKT